MKHIISLDRIDPPMLPHVGSKAMNLGLMMRQGWRVPPGFVIMTDAFADFVDHTHLGNQIDVLVGQIRYDDMSQVKKVADDINSLITRGTFPRDLENEIFEYANSLGSSRVAVRSSATSEDTASSSSAGQQETFLNISVTAGHGTSLLDAIRSCWASYYSHTALMYRHTRRQDTSGGIAVVIQRMVDSEQSGVAFSVDPVTGDQNHITIEAICGLGELIVQGEVTPDHYIVNKNDLLIVEKRIALQEKQLMFLDGKNSIVPLPPSIGERQKISDEIIHEIAELVKKVKVHMVCPQDIEWASEQGHLWLIQARRITTL